MIADARHGSARDRGSADRYYGRPFDPHYFEGATLPLTHEARNE